MKKLYQNNAGFTLIEFIFVMSIIGFFLILGVRAQQNESNLQKGREIGVKFMEYNQGVSRFISYNTASAKFREEDTDNDEEVIYSGIDWLRSSECDDAGLADKHYLPCDFKDGLPYINETTFVTRIDVTEKSYLTAKTHIDLREGDLGEGNLYKISESMLGLAAITAIGGDGKEIFLTEYTTDVSSTIDSEGNPTTKISLGATDNEYIYCPRNLPEESLSPLCTIDDAELSGGLLIAYASSQSSIDSWLRADGSNKMNNSFVFNEEVENRDIRFIDRLYNITGQALILGNSGVFNNDVDAFTPLLGSGLVFDTDSYIKGSMQNDLNIETKGEIIAGGDIITNQKSIAINGVGTGGNIDIAGDLTVSDESIFANGIQSGGQLSANVLRADSLIDAQGYYVLGGVVAERVVTSPYVRSSEMLISDQDISVTNDATMGGNISIEQNLYVGGETLIEGNLAVENGSSYLASVYSDFIIDNDGDYLLDPSNISLMNILRSGNLAPSEYGGKLNFNAQAIYFASEDVTCNLGDLNFEQCATEVGGYVDISEVHIKSPADGQWVSFLDVLNGFDEYNSNTIDEVDRIGQIITDAPPAPIIGSACDGNSFAEPMGRTDAISAESRGWSCTKQDGYIDEDSGEDLYLCTATCNVPIEPTGECTPEGVLSNTVTINGSIDNTPNNWSCSETSNIGGVPIYTCEIGCTPPPTETYTWQPSGPVTTSFSLWQQAKQNSINAAPQGECLSFGLVDYFIVDLNSVCEENNPNNDCRVQEYTCQ